MQEFPITGEYIELFKLLKASGISEYIETGSDAKRIVAGGIVLRNGEVETRKAAKIRVGEVITIEDESITVTQG